MTERSSEQKISSTSISTKDTNDIEINIATDMAKRAWILFVPAAIVMGLISGTDAAFAVIVAGVMVVINMLIAAEISRVTGRISPHAMMVGAMAGFVLRLALIFGVALVVMNIDSIDFTVWILSVAIGHIALLTWETRNLSFSLADPGVKTKD